MPQSRKIALSSPKKRSSLESASSSPSSINKKDLDQLNTIGTSLTSRKDIESFLSLVVKRSRQIVVGDCSALYLIQKVEDKEEEKLRLHQHNFEHETLELFPKELPLSEQSLAGKVACYQKTIRINENFSSHPLYESSIQDHGTSYYPLESAIALPLVGSRNHLLGVLLIFNKKADRKEKIQHPQSFTILPFSDDDESLLLSIVGQTSIGIENTKLYESISKLFDGFIRASIMAIEARDPSTFGHSERVAKLTIALAKEVTYQTSGPLSHKSFSSRDLKELEYAALLHDFGKIGVRESVLTKAKKLHDFEIHAIKDRLDLWRQSIIIEYQQKIIELHTTNHKSLELDQKIQQLEEKHVKELQRVDHIFDLIILNNEPSILSKTELVEIESLLDLTFFRPNGEKDVILHSDQIQRLSIPRGSLSESERKEIELHVNITYQFLNQIPWTSEFENIPSIAYAHHEKLDGSGYPLGKVSHQIPYAAKLMTVTDVFDALVARDRPYKKAMPVKKALQVLQQEAQENKLDQELVALFQQKKLYQAIGQY